LAKAPQKATSLNAKRSRVAIEHIDEIVINNARIQVRGMDIPLSEVQLDQMNPRLANTVSLNYREDEKHLQSQLESILWADRDVKDLYQSVKKNGGLIERIIVRANGVVAEGNCRTVVYRKLHEQFGDDPTWKTIPARVLPDEIDEKQIAILLGELHVGGKNEWSPFEKAGHIYELFHTHGLTQDEIAKLLHTSKTAVNHNVHAFAAMKERYLLEYPGPAGVRRFSYFLELYKKPFLREWVKNSPSALNQFVRWVGTEKIGKGAEVRHLDAIIQNARALKAFDVGGMDAARPILIKDRPELTSPVFKGMIELTKTIEDARLDDIARVRSEKSGGTRTIVQELKDALDKFMDLCGGFK
jgi:ParB-like chromosome segregation protein Spo0J